MLPQSHAFVALGLLKLLRDRNPQFPAVDYRKAALVAMLPDLIDKPLAVFVFPDMKAGLLFAHAPVFHLAWLLVSRWRKEWWPYALAFTSHIIADRIWFFHDTFWFPLRGFRFHQWKHIGDPKAFGLAYRDLFKRRPGLLLYEVAALLVLLWFLVSSGLTNRSALWRWLRTGQMPITSPTSFPLSISINLITIAACRLTGCT